MSLISFNSVLGKPDCESTPCLPFGCPKCEAGTPLLELDGLDIEIVIAGLGESEILYCCDDYSEINGVYLATFVGELSGSSGAACSPAVRGNTALSGIGSFDCNESETTFRVRVDLNCTAVNEQCLSVSIVYDDDPPATAILRWAITFNNSFAGGIYNSPAEFIDKLLSGGVVVLNQFLPTSPPCFTGMSPTATVRLATI